MTIEEKCYLYGSCKCQNAGCVVRPDNGCPVYRYFKGIIVKDYENRLNHNMGLCKNCWGRQNQIHSRYN